jgi:hypothetical protein
MANEQQEKIIDLARLMADRAKQFADHANSIVENVEKGELLLSDFAINAEARHLEQSSARFINALREYLPEA